MSNLCQIMKAAGSDKGLDWHNYTVFYHHLFSEVRGDITDVFELGLGTQDTSILSSMKSGHGYSPGASHRGWAEYFPNARIWGADIDDKILDSNDPRVQFFWVDQTDATAVAQLWSQSDLTDIQFDFILDDGLHTLPGAQGFLETSIHKLKHTGVYIIEDVQGNQKQSYLDYLDSVQQDLGIQYVYYALNYIHNRTDNNLIVIQKSGQSYYLDRVATFHE